MSKQENIIDFARALQLIKYKITYWDAGDQLITVEVEAANATAAIEKLADDPQHPLAQVKTVVQI